MAIPRNLIDEINEKTDILALVSPYVNLTKRGKNYMGQCPFHDDKSPSFSVSPEKHLAKCMACGEGGTAITFYSKIKHISFDQAAAELAIPLGIKLDIDVVKNDDRPEHALMKEAGIFYEYYLHNSESGKLALAYLAKRGLTMDDIKHFQIGLAPKEKSALYQILSTKGFDANLMMDAGLVKTREDGSYYDLMNYRITFPIHDEVGRIVGFSGRTLGDDQVKYLNTPETDIFHKGDTLYHLSLAQRDIRMSKKIILHEGFFDVIASYKAGIKYGVATMGTALTKKQAQLIKTYANRVIIAYDGDKAGQNATIKAIPLLQEVGLRVDIVSLKEQLDPDDYIQKYGIESYQKAIEDTKDPYQFGYQYYKQGLDLKNANDINTFKKNVLFMLKGQDRSIREIYLKKLSEDIGASYDSVMPKTSYESYDIPKKETRVTIKKDVATKFIRAERELLVAMMREPSLAQRIDQTLNTQFVADMDLFKIRATLMLGYYAKYDTFDLETFEAMLSEDEKIILDTKVTSHTEWRSHFTYNEDAITRLLDLMVSIQDSKAYQSLLKEIKDVNEAYTQTLLVEKQKQLKNKLSKRQVDV